MDLSIGILKRTAGGSDAQPRKEKKDDAELVEIFKPNQNNLLQFLKYPTFKNRARDMGKQHKHQDLLMLWF